MDIRVTGWKCGLNSSVSGWGSVAGYCEQDNKLPGSLMPEIFEWMINCQLLQLGSPPWNQLLSSGNSGGSSNSTTTTTTSSSISSSSNSGSSRSNGSSSTGSVVVIVVEVVIVVMAVLLQQSNEVTVL